MHGPSIRKYIWLIGLIDRNPGISFKKISDAWVKATHINFDQEPLPRRTFNNWKDSIYKEFGLKLVCSRSTNGYHFEHIDDIKKGEVRSWLLDALAVTNMLNERDALEGRILLENNPSGREYLQPIIDAMKDNRLLEITYKDFADPEPYTVILAPYCVKVFERRWNVVGKTGDNKELERFSLDRIKDIKVLEETFSMPKNFDAADYFADCYGVARYDFYGHMPPPTHVVIRVDSAQRDYVRTLKLHHSQKEIATTDDYSDFELFVRPTYDFIQFILTLNFRTQIIAPAELRKTMADIVYLMADNYRDCYDESYDWGWQESQN